MPVQGLQHARQHLARGSVRKALESELNAKGLKTESQKEFEVYYFDKRVGHYHTDLLVEGTVIVELKAAPELLPLHRAQLISYFVGFGKPLGILANFGGPSMAHQTLPRYDINTALINNFDFDKVRLKGREKIKDLLFMANRIQTTLGAGYLHQIYRRAFYHELKQAVVNFHSAKEVVAEYRNERLGERKVNFFILGDLLLSAVAVGELDKLTISRFRSYVRYLKLKRGLIFNFNALHLDFRYVGDGE